jgi:phosphodiesterase/alkaline phosphatase D-like protein
MTLSRRNFFLAAAAAGGAAAAAATVGKKPAVSRSFSGKDERATRGYQATAHVANYYRTTKV